jgi:DNA-binding response OmpR family regulator
MDATAVLSLLSVPGSHLLFVDDEPATSRCIPALSRHYDVSVATTIETALRAVHEARPTVVVTELVLPDGTGTSICRAAKKLSQPPAVLITTREVDRVPDALEAGCDAVLLKPFAPNLLITRLSRLKHTQARSQELRVRSTRQRAKAAHLHERAELLRHGTNNHWPNTHCPYCTHQGVTSFEFMSYRRSWYACLACRKVWIAPRQEAME